MRTTKGILLLLSGLTLGLFSASIYLFKERNTNHSELQSLGQIMADQELNLEALTKERDELKAGLIDCTSRVSNHLARNKNLEAQISHLKKDLEKSWDEKAELNQSNELLTQSLNETRQSLLEFNRTKVIEPDKLESLEAELERLKLIDEKYLDLLSQSAPRLEFLLESSDNDFIALKRIASTLLGNVESKYLICRKNTAIALIEFRTEDAGLILAKVNHWFESRSILVKGEKLFIFRAS